MRPPTNCATIMRARRHLAPSAPDAFSIDSSATFQNLLGKIINNFGAVVAAIATISLVVGGIVIMNIMLVAVTERTREIGVRKALGARRHDILMQFLIESATLSLTGGVIGVIAGIVIAKLHHARHLVPVRSRALVDPGQPVCVGIGGLVLRNLSGLQSVLPRSDCCAASGVVKAITVHSSQFSVLSSRLNRERHV